MQTNYFSWRQTKHVRRLRLFDCRAVGPCCERETDECANICRITMPFARRTREHSRCKNAHKMHIFGESWAFRHVHWALETFIILVASTKASIGEDGNSSFFRTHGYRNAFRLTLVQTGECLVVPRSVCWSNLFDSRRARLQTWDL